MPSWQTKSLRFLQRLAGLLGCLFALQKQVVDHPSRWKALLTPRRAGKTELACAWLLDAAIKNPGKKFLYVALTRPSAQDIAWGIFHRLNDTFNLGAQFHDSRLDITLPNGSKILLRGADQPNWVSRLEGQEFHLIVIDESGLYSIDMRKLVYGSFGPMIMKGGSILLIGRPGDVKYGLFWDITRPDLRPGPRAEDGSWIVVDHEGGVQWSVFGWAAVDNPYVAEWWTKTVEEMMRINPEALQSPLIRRHLFGEWAEDSDKSVYGSFSVERNVTEEWVPMDGDRFGMATDFGWDDAQAFLVGCWNPARPDFVVLESYSEKNMPLKTALDRIAMYQERYPGLLMWGDPARKQLYMEMAIRFGACVNVAEKQEKHDFIDLLNNDFALGRVKIVRATNEGLVKELVELKKLVKEDGTWVEHPKQKNDRCDTLLYCWRHSRHYRYEEPKMGPAPGTPAYADQMMKEAFQREEERMKRKQSRNSWRPRFDH